ncbi:MAG TPA: glycosyltransferase family 4 protein [Anaerolineales bacterium]|nr:glycosyltransferase family 4 protein [Anaerolineales bacterium]
MRILVIIYEYPPVGGGGGRAAQDLCREMHKRGHQITVLTSNYRGLPRQETQNGVRIVRVPAFRRQPYKAGLLTMGAFVLTGLWLGLSLARNWSPEVIHAHFAVPSGALAWAISRLTRTPYVLTAHLGDVPGGVPEKTSRWFRWFYPFTHPLWRDAAQVVAVSHYTRQLALNHYQRDILVLPNGVNLAELNPGEIRVGNPPQIIFAGRFVPQKNLIQLINILAEIKDLRWKCVLLGDGPLRRAVEETIKARRLEARITLPGWVTPEQVIEQFQKSDVLLMPSLSEGFPVVAVQAIAMGLAVVGSQVGGLVDLVEHGKNGFLYPSDDTAGMANGLSKLLCDTQLLRAAREASRRIAHRFDLQAVADGYEQIFDNALAVIGGNTG